jgi:hypothetical protein
MVRRLNRRCVLNKHLLSVIGAASVLVSGAACAQGLPFSSGSATDRPWAVNQMEPHDPNAFQASADQSQSTQLAALQDRVAAEK